MATVAKNSRSTTSTLASATAGPFSVGFRLFDDDALLVYVNGVSRADWTLSSTYADGYDDDASITFDAALDIADDLRIEGWLSPARSADYVNGDPGLTDKMNIELARLWSSVIEVKREVSRALRGFDDLSPVDGVDLETVASAEAYATSASASASAAAASEAAALAAENSLLEWAGAWQTATAYAPSDIVQESGNSYVCLVAHTSGVFATDLAALKWELFAAKGSSGAGTGDVVAANNGTEFTAATFAANLALVQTSRAISAGTGLTGGGDLSADRSIAADIASQAEAEAGSSSTKLMTPQRVAQALSALGAGVGSGQTWQDVKASRTHNTTYQNTTGQPIQVVLQVDGGSYFQVSADGIAWITLGFFHYFAAHSAIIPNGWYYRKSGTHVIYYWSELRP